MLLALFAGTPATAQVPAPTAIPTSPPLSCLSAIARAERQHRLPQGLLISIALAESGRRDPATGVVTPWPWTINVQGRGHFYETIDQAMVDVRALLQQNIGVIDVGCLQVDLYHHPQAFRTLRMAFDPDSNVDYAARFLTDLRRRTGSWGAAIAAYNAGDPSRGEEYLARVLSIWRGGGARLDPAAPGRSGRGFVVDETPKPFDAAATFYARKDYDSALAIYRAALAARPDDRTALLGAAECLKQTGKEEQARGYLERALTADPHDRPALNSLLRLIDDGPQARRMARLLSARQLVPQAPQIPARLAALRADQGQLAEATALMANAVQLAPEDAVMRLNYALLLDRSGNARAAMAAYEAFLRLYRSDGPALTVSLQRIKERYAYLQRGGR